MKNKDLEKVKKEFFNHSLEWNWSNVEILLSIIDHLQEKIYNTIQYCEESSKTIKSDYFSDVIKILKGDSYEK